MNSKSPRSILQPFHSEFRQLSFGTSDATADCGHVFFIRRASTLFPLAMGAEQSTQMDTTRAVAAGATAYKNTHEEMPKTVQELTDAQLGELVASTMDFCTSHYGSIPTNPELIKMAQKALESLNIKGELKDREKDIARIVDMMLEDVETA